MSDLAGTMSVTRARERDGPMSTALAQERYYGGSAPPAPSAGVAPIPARPPGREAGAERTQVVPTFTVVRSTG
jgi:hypothetical protein